MTALVDTGFDLLLCLLIIGVALGAMTIRDLFGAVVLFIVYGIFIALAWLRLEAIDVALAEAALGAGLTGVLLLGALARLPRPAATAEPSRSGPGRSWAEAARRVATAVVALAVALGLGWGFLGLPTGRGLAPLVADNIALSGVSNPVTAVLLNFRGWDTLLESVVLVASLVGVWSVSRDADWGAQPGLRQHVRAGGVLQSFGRVLPPVGLLLGVYLVWVGASRPGGAFQGGTVLAAVALLVAMAGLMQPPSVLSRRARLVLVVGPAVFLAVGIGGALAGQFLWLPPEMAKPLILGIEVMLTLSIAVTLALLVIGPPGRAEATETTA